MAGLAGSHPWLNWRNRLLASEGFRKLACRFAPTRWIARRRASALFDLVAGFVYSQVLLACVRLKLFDVLADGPHVFTARQTEPGKPESPPSVALTVTIDTVGPIAPLVPPDLEPSSDTGASSADNLTDLHG